MILTRRRWEERYVARLVDAGRMRQVAAEMLALIAWESEVPHTFETPEDAADDLLSRRRTPRVVIVPNQETV